jgi:hypothetical protein
VTARILAALVVVLVAVACTSPTPSGPAPATGPAASALTGVPKPDHIVVVVLENKDSSSILGSPQAPYLTSLAAQSAVFTDSHAITHPSQPNYLALFAGSTQGVVDDGCPLSVSSENLASELSAAGLSFGGFSEDLPSTGYTGCATAQYARKHNPWVNFTNVAASSNRPFADFGPDYSTLPTVSFVAPNLCNDMHDCSVRTGDAWLREHIQPYLDWAGSHDSLLVVTFDEAERSATNQIMTLFAGPMVAAGTYAEHIDHYRVLRTIQDAYRLTHVGYTVAADPITEIWRAR